MVRKRGNFCRRVGSAQKPHANLVEQRNGEPRKAIELLGMHGGTTCGVFHLENIARRILAPAYDFLCVVTEEHERIAAARTHVAILLRDFVVDVFAGSGRVVHVLEANPGKVAFIDRLGRALEHARIGRREASRDFRKRSGCHMRATLERLCRETREIVGRKLDRFARSNIPRERAQEFRRHHTHHNSLIKTAAIYFFGVPFANRTPKTLWLRPVREPDAEDSLVTSRSRTGRRKHHAIFPFVEPYSKKIAPFSHGQPHRLTRASSYVFE